MQARRFLLVPGLPVLQALLVAGRRELSLVDCSSFQLMRRSGLDTAFAFDPDFGEQGFDVLPGVGA